MGSTRRFRLFERLESRYVMTASTSCWIEPMVEPPADAAVDDHAIDSHSDHSDADHSEIQTDANGNQYYIDPLPADGDVATHDEGHDDEDHGDESSPPDDSEPIPMAADGTLTVPIYHSNPDASKKIFLDFDGHTVTGTSWNSSNNGNPIHARAYSIDDDIFSFNEEELGRLFEVWERVSEDYSPFHVDVTTEDPGSAFFASGGQGIRVLISTNVDDSRLGGTDNEWFGEAGGVGYVNSWNWVTDTPVWVFSDLLGNGVKKVSEAAAHEVGHALGLSHDGTVGGTEYFEGHGNWAPIMGNGYYNDITQWSRGEYDDASNTEDDLWIITNKIPYRVDDHNNTPNGFTDPTPLTVDGETLSASGIIEQASDVDAFLFTVGPGAATVQLDFEPFHSNPNLNIRARLHAENGTILYESDPQGLLNATIDTTLDPGDYYLAVTGVGEGNPASDGYSQYATLGQYTISGTVSTVLGDLNYDAVVDAADIDLLRVAILASSDDPIYDLNGNGVVDQFDRDHLIYNILRTTYGDANLDQVVDAVDYQIWTSNNFQLGTGWATGDFTGDFVTDVSDFNVWSEYRFQAIPTLAEAAPLPPAISSISRVPRAPLSRPAARVITSWNQLDSTDLVTCPVVSQPISPTAIPQTPSTSGNLPAEPQFVASTSMTIGSEIVSEAHTNRQTDVPGDSLVAPDRAAPVASKIRRGAVARRGDREARLRSGSLPASVPESDSSLLSAAAARNELIDVIFRRFPTV